MRLVLFCLALGALPLSGQVAPLTVYTQFKHPPPATIVASLKSEVESIVTPLGLDVEWRTLNSAHGNEISQELAIVTIKGTCDNIGPPPPSFSSGALGWTHITDGVILPFMDVDCDRIRGFVRNQMVRVAPGDRDKVLGRAIGRVMAHELYHILGKRSHHGSGSVDRPAYTTVELVSDQFLLEEAECRILQLAGSRALPPPGAAVGSVKKGQAKFIEKQCGACHGDRGQGTRRAPALRASGRVISEVAFAAMLGIDGSAMCRRADQLKIVPPSLGPSDIPDLLRFLNAPPY